MHYTERKMGAALAPITGSPKQPHITIAVPSTNTWHALFGMSLLFLVLRLSSQGFSVTVVNSRGSLLPTQRHKCVRFAQEQGATHLLFIDSDQTFPDTLAESLLSHGHSVVGCNIATKQFPSTPTARRRGPDAAGIPVYTTPKSPRKEKVWRLGTGIMLLKMSVFDRLGPPPWFAINWAPEVGSYRGEDWYFCELLEKAGIAIWVDHHTSMTVGHVGDVEYTHEMVAVPAELAQEIQNG